MKKMKSIDAFIIKNQKEKNPFASDAKTVCPIIQVDLRLRIDIYINFLFL